MDWVDSAAIISPIDELPVLAPNAQGFDKYTKALEDLAREFSTHPSFSGTDPLSWNDLLNLYTRDDKSYGGTLYPWATRAFGKPEMLPTAKKDCWSFLLKMFGMDVADKDAAEARLSELNINQEKIEEEIKKFESKQQKDKEYAENLLRDANKELKERFQIIGEDGMGLCDMQTMVNNRLTNLREQHKSALDELKKKVIALSEASQKRQTLQSEKGDCESEINRLDDASKNDERSLHKAREEIARVKQRFDDCEFCENGQILICKCLSAQYAKESLPHDLIKNARWKENNEAKEAKSKEKIRARIQELNGEIVTAQAREKELSGFLAGAEDAEQKLRIGIEELTNVVNLRERANRLEKTILERNEAEAGYTERIEMLTQIRGEIADNKTNVQNHETLLRENLNQVNMELELAAKQFLGSKASASLEIRNDGLGFVLSNGSGGGGDTYNSVVRPLILDWLAVYYGIIGKSPHQALFIQDSPFQHEMQPELQQKYIEMLLSFSADRKGLFQQITLTSSSGVDNIPAEHVNIAKLTSDLPGRLLPEVDLSRQGFIRL